MLLFMFIIIPFIEVVFFIFLGDFIGFWATIGIIIITACVGVHLLRKQSFEIFSQLHHKGLNNLGLLADGISVFIAAILLITPGFFTDIFGFCLLIPPIRHWLWIFGLQHLANKINILNGRSGFINKGFDFARNGWHHRTYQDDNNAGNETPKHDSDHDDVIIDVVPDEPTKHQVQKNNINKDNP